ncbi:hypothetical protein TraAM80_03150 [Trypanosoma rangeli]|uniref:Calcium uniporter protein C-terminal domain-containing protein n=1 Tax=Trypanosoma rangeli TaxID=5698 RepID=A0A422NQP4_TRYRA|nr:uncharacterized protein TraAM80_03150 [Trypanosoma rangeli]RNF07776.1 hypothetical protein TraAM80_03150 [Trypanosoma rangeli]|eukprot:RNF07776.1 hypothetical protein TraAM80_03150 [Trypanosoma rangeli]
MAALRTVAVAEAGALRLLRIIHPLRSRHHHFHSHSISLRTCSHGVTSVPAGNLTPESIALFHSYGASAAGRVPVVMDATALNEVLHDMLVPDDAGTSNVVRELRRTLSEKREEVAPLLAEKYRIDHAVDNRYVPLLRYLTLAALLAQFVILFRWVFVVFDWNLVEPMTYFLGCTVAWASTVFHCYHAKEFTWEAILDAVAQRRRLQLYRKAGVNVANIERLQQQIRMLERMISKY